MGAAAWGNMGEGRGGRGSAWQTRVKEEQYGDYGDCERVDNEVTKEEDVQPMKLTTGGQAKFELVCCKPSDSYSFDSITRLERS